MSESASMPPNLPRGDDPAAEPPQPVGKPDTAETSGTPRTSARVITRSSRVRELPPPPKILSEPPDDRQRPPEPSSEPASEPLPELPAVENEPPLPPIELSGLQIVPPRRLLRWRRRRAIRPPSRWQRWMAAPRRRRLVGYATSSLCHLLLILLLAFWMGAGPPEPAGGWIHGRSFQDVSAEEANHEGPLIEQAPRDRGGPAESDPPAVPEALPPKIAAIPLSLGGVGALSASAMAAGNPASGGSKPKARPDLLLAADTPVQGKLNRRSPGGRSEGVRYGGGTLKSEETVERGLHWLLAHQRDDGSWHFNHITDACQHYCTNPGTEASTTAATALALLPFLGAGYTHKEGEYQDAVRRGLDYLRTRGVVISYGLDLRDGSMYGQGLATIALCEAYGLTHDAALKEPAQGGLKYIAYAQDAKGGGWRYTPGEPGDTTVTGWLLMALKSGQMAGLEVSTPTIFASERFLSSVQNEDGSQYGYMSRRPRQSTTAVALLCRMYTGWRHDNAALVKGVGHLSGWGPSPDDLYYDYYATQVLFHWAGPEWNAWNSKMRDLLIGRQDRAGHQSGSWYFDGVCGKAGGRLYSTAMATMILEVYYRYMPLFSENAVDGKF